jgi:DNA-binding transcriptional LysR family regulator
MFQLLETFTTVYEEQNFTKAAKKLYISQPTISVHIEKLERDLGVNLFIRSGNNRIAPTKAADFLYEKAKQMKNNWSNVLSELSRLDGTLRKKFKIAASQTIGDFLLPQILKPLKIQFPYVDFNFFIENSNRVFHSVHMLDADIGLVESPEIVPGVKREIFMWDEMVVLGAAENKTWIYREKGSGIRDYMDQYLLMENIQPEEKMIMNHNAMIHQAVELGLGRTLQSKFVTHSKHVPQEKTSLNRPFYLITSEQNRNLDVDLKESIFKLLAELK